MSIITNSVIVTRSDHTVWRWCHWSYRPRVHRLRVHAVRHEMQWSRTRPVVSVCFWLIRSVLLFIICTHQTCIHVQQCHIYSVYTCMHCTYVYVYIHMYALYICVHIHTHVCTVRTYVYVYIHKYALYIYMCTYTYIHMYALYICVHIHTHVYTVYM